MKQIFPEGLINRVIGKCIILNGNDIDTDRIIPARFLKCVNFQALGNQVFADDREELKGLHPFDLDINKNASILIVNENFGCGSSREHAPQALMRWGIRAVIGQSFAEIFYGNCLALGIPCATCSAQTIQKIQSEVESDTKQKWELNLRNQLLSNEVNKIKVNIEPGPMEMLLSGNWDGTSQLLSQKERLDEITIKLPYLNNFP